MKFKISNISFSSVLDLINADFSIENNKNISFIFGDDKVFFEKASYGDTLDYFISLDYIYIPSLKVNIHSLSCEFKDKNIQTTPDYSGYIIRSIESNDSYFIECESYLDTILINFLNFYEYSCYNNVSSLICDIILFI